MINENVSVNECYDGYNANFKGTDKVLFRDGKKAIIIPFKEICAYYKQDSKIMRGYYYDIILIEIWLISILATFTSGIRIVWLLIIVLLRQSKTTIMVLLRFGIRKWELMTTFIFWAM